MAGVLLDRAQLLHLSALNVSSLTACTGLQQLTIKCYRGLDDVAAASLLSNLTQLTSINLQCPSMKGVGLRPLVRALTGLEALHLRWFPDFSLGW